MIEGVAAVERVEAAGIAVASGATVRNTRLWREKRLRFLGALREATGDAGALGDADEGDEIAVPTSRARIGAAQERIVLLATPEPAIDAAPADAAAVARSLSEAGARSIAIQARLGAISVQGLVAANAVNGA